MNITSTVYFTNSIRYISERVTKQAAVPIFSFTNLASPRLVKVSGEVAKFHLLICGETAYVIYSIGYCRLLCIDFELRTNINALKYHLYVQINVYKYH